MVVDSYALLAWMQGEPAAGLVRAVLAEAKKAGKPLLMSWINVGEVFYSIAKDRGLVHAEDFLERLPALPIRCDAPSDRDILAAARLKASYPISYADSFAAELAIRYSMPVLTGDVEFLKLKKVVAIQWIGGARKH